MKTATITLFDNGTASLKVHGEQYTAFAGPEALVRSMALRFGYYITVEQRGVLSL